MSTNVHPEILDGLDYESQFIQRTSGSQRRTVKLNRGDSWLLRFLPAQLGPNKRWYARVAKHWVNQRAIVCPRDTEEAFGGHPDAYCPVCDLSAHLNDERNEEVSKFGFKLRATPNWITYCAVFAKATNGGNAQDMPLPEVLQPYEFQHYKTTWEELKSFVQNGVRRTPLSVFDFEKGNDFYVTKTPKGLRLDKQDSGPIFDLNDPNFDANVEKLMAACKDPVVKIPDEKAMETFADKAQEEANNIARGRSSGGGNSRGGGARGGRGGGGGDEDDLPPEDDAPPARGRNYDQQESTPARGRTAPAAEAPPARRAAAPAQESAAPARRAAPAPAAAPAARRAAPAPAPAPEPEQEPPPEEQGEGEQQPVDEAPPEEQQPEPAPAPAPLRRAPAPAAAPAAARPSATRPSASRTATPAPARAAAPAAPARTAAAAPAPARGGGAPVQESLDEEEHVPEEANDQAPPAPLDLGEDGSAAAPADAGEAPPAVETARRGFSNSIRSKIAAVNTSAKK
jgi:uncharacterized membrane protein YgcG